MVHLVEAVTVDDIRVKKISVDGIQNTIKYEISSNISFDADKKLTVESELNEAVQAYTIEHADIQLSIKSVSPDIVKLVLVESRDVDVSVEYCRSLVSEIFDECDHIH